jgi:hypothetical protein
MLSQINPKNTLSGGHMKKYIVTAWPTLMVIIILAMALSLPLLGSTCTFTPIPTALIVSPSMGDTYATSQTVSFSANLTNVTSSTNMQLNLDMVPVTQNGWVVIQDETDSEKIWITDFVKDLNVGIISFKMSSFFDGGHQITITFPDQETSVPGLVQFAVHAFGTGASGALSITSNTTWSSVTGVRYAVVQGIGSDYAVIDSSSGFTVGDEILMINSQGNTSAYGSVGTWEILTIKTISGNTIYFTAPVEKSYGSGQKIQMLRIPQFTDFTISATVSLPAWNGSIYGIMAFRANNTLTFGDAGQIYATAKGYRGWIASDGNAYYGEGVGGIGQTAGSFNGGAAGSGGSYGANGGAHYENGNPTCNNPTGPSAETPSVGDIELLKIIMGGAGGSTVDNDANYDTTGGGYGGGVVMFGAKNASNVSIVSNGTKGGNANPSTKCDCDTAAGGGAGGAIYMSCETIGIRSVTAIGGNGGTGGCNSYFNGGNGGVGRIRIDSSNITGSTTPSAYVPQPEGL